MDYKYLTEGLEKLQDKDGFIIFQRLPRDIEAGRIKTWLWHKYYDWETKNIQRRRAEYKTMLRVDSLASSVETILSTRDILILNELEKDI